MRIICCRFGKKYTDWHVKNLKHMIDTHSGLKYDEFQVIETDLYGNWYNKLQMYDKFRDGENLYFDLDIVIYNKVPNLIRKNFTLLHDYMRPQYHTPLNSSIVSWTGDVSHIWKKFKENDDFYMTKYNKGSDEFYFREIEYETYEPSVFYCIKTHQYEKKRENYSICTFNQRHYLMEEGWTGWWNDYFIEKAT